MDPNIKILDGDLSNSNFPKPPIKSHFFASSLYFFLAVLMYGLAATFQFDLVHKSFGDWMNSYIGTGPGGDPIQFMWFLAWWPYALTHGLDPFQTHAIWSPSGVNLLWVTSVPGLSLVVWPILHKVGLIACYNILVVLAPVLSASAAYLLAYEITASWFSSFFGGYFFGFSSYEIIYSNGGDLNLSFVIFVPLLLLIILRSSNKNWSILFSGLVMGIILLFQFLVSTEIIATFTLFLGISMIFVYVFIQESRKKIQLLIPRILSAYLFLLLFLIPIYYPLYQGEIYGGGDAASTYDSGNDLLSPLIPQGWTRLGGMLLKLPGDGLLYLGLPLVFILFLIIKKRRSNPLEKGLLLCFGVFFLASMGPTLHVAGFCLSTLPWTLFEHLPLIGYAFPFRFSMYIWLIFGLLVAVWLKDIKFLKEKISRISILFLGMLFIWPNHDVLGSWTPVHIPRIFSTGEICHEIEGGKKLMILPWGVHGDSELYQVSSGMCFSMPEGYIGAVPYPFNMWPINYRLVQDRFDAVSAEIFGSYLATYNVGTIAVLHNIKNQFAAQALLTSVGFYRTESIGMVDLYKSNGLMNFPMVDAAKLRDIGIERGRHLREKVILHNRKDIERVLSKNGIISPKTGDDLYTWLLNHHILK